MKSNYFHKKEQRPDRLSKIPLDQDEAFLVAVKAELLGLRQRIKHETL